MNIFNGKNHRTRRAIRPLTLALTQQNIYKGKYRPSNLTHTAVKKKKKHLTGVVEYIGNKSVPKTRPIIIDTKIYFLKLQSAFC